MANHLTPEELSKEMGIDRLEVIRVCMQEGVPIYQGKIDKTLFQAQLAALGTPARGPSLVGTSRRSFEPPRASGSRPSRRLFFFGLASLTSSTLFLSASMRSTTGVSSATGSGFAISWPSSFASSICFRFCRYSLVSSVGVELAFEAVDHLLREAELGLLHLAARDGFLDLGLRVDVLRDEQRLERKSVALRPDQAQVLGALPHEPPQPGLPAFLHGAEQQDVGPLGCRLSRRGEVVRPVEEDGIHLGRVHEAGDRDRLRVVDLHDRPRGLTPRRSRTHPSRPPSP